MMRYIDADAATERFKQLHGAESELLNCYNADWIISFIEAQPAADVQEVKHGKWLTDRFGMERSICSICETVYEGGDPFRFCPKCGARMDAEE